MKFKQKLERSLSVRFSTSGRKKLCSSSNIGNGMQSGNLKTNDYCYKTEIDSELSSENLNYRNKAETCCSLLSERTRIDEGISTKKTAVQGYTANMLENDDENYHPLKVLNNCENFPLESDSVRCKCTYPHQKATVKRRKKENIFKRSFYKTRKKAGFVKRISKSKDISKINTRNLPANLKSHFLAEIVDISKHSFGRKCFEEGKQQSVGNLIDERKPLDKIIERSNLQLNLKSENIKEPKLNEQKSDAQNLESETHAVKAIKDLSPTCADIYGTDEIDNVSFSNLIAEGDLEPAFDSKIDKVTEDREAEWCEENTKINKIYDIFCAGTPNAIDTDNEFSEISKLQRDNNVGVTATGESCENESKSRKYLKRVSVEDNDLSGISCLRKMNSHSDIPNTEESEMYENPWVLQDYTKKSTTRSVIDTNIEIESSLGFEVNIANQEGTQHCDSALVRSNSFESVDSFGSSYHSVNSVKDLYFSDSEAEHNLDNISYDSAVGGTEPSVSKMELDSSEHITDLDQASTNDTDLVQTSKNLFEGSKGSKRTSSMDNLSRELDHKNRESKSSEDSDSDQKQMIPYSLAESFSGNVTVRRKKKKLHSRSFDEKLDKSVVESPERHNAGKKTNLIKSISLGFPAERESKSGEKVKHYRRSLDSSLAQRNIMSELQSLERQSNEFLSPVLESDIKAVKTDKHKHEETDKNLDPTRFFTLPNPKKLRSQQQNLKKRLSRLGSVSKMITDKANSLSSLKMGASFKLRKEIEKSKELVSSSATSFSDLMSKKASSFSTLIRRRTYSNTVVESPFKQYARKVNKVKDENKSELVYEKVRVRVPTKRPVTALEQSARSKRLKVNLRLAKNACKSESDKNDFDSNSRANSYIGRPWSSTSISPLKSPTLLDEIMKSVDSARVRQQCSVSNDDLDPSDCGESSSGSSLFLFQKQYSLESDTNLAKDTTLMTVCRVCGKLRSSSERNSDSTDSLIVKRHSGSYRFSFSLCDLSSACQCVNQNKTRKRLSVILPVTETFTQKSDLSKNRRSWDIISDCKDSVSGEIKGGNVFRKRKILLPSGQRPSSMFDLRYNLDETESGQVEFEIGGAISRESIDESDALPGTLLRQKPLLDLSGEHLDEAGDSQKDLIDDKEESYTKKSQSCGDLLESGRYCENEIKQSDLVKVKAEKENDEETESFHSCSDEVETDFVFEGNSDKQKSHSCSNLLDTNEVSLEDKLKLEEQRKKEMRKVKVKSMSSSHDALSALVLMETIDITEVDKALAANLGSIINGKDVENGQSIVNNIIELTQNGLEIDKTVSEKHPDSENNTELENETTVECSIADEDNKENTVCQKCNCLRNDEANKIKHKMTYGLKSPDNVSCKIISKPPLPRHRRQAKVLSLSDISNHDNMDSKDLRRQKGFSMIELHEGNRNECMCECGCESSYRKLKSQPKTFSDKSKSGITPKSGSLKSHVRKFLFDDQQVQSYIKTVSKFDRQRSISSDHINIGTVDTPKQSGSDKLHSACSLNLLSGESDVFNRLSFPLGPQLSPYVEFFESTPVKGFSRLSGPRFTSPGFLPELPELPSLTEESVYKYDVCLGYLLHSVQCDNKMICVYSLQRNKQLMESVITPLTASPHTPRRKSHEHGSVNKNKGHHKTKLEEFPNPAAPITNVPSDRLARAGLVLRTVLLARAPHMIRDRKFHLRTYRRCMVGTEMVDWLLQQSALVHSRTQAVGMWQALVEEGVIVHVCHEHQFKDKYLFYRFHEDDEGVSTVPSSATKRECEEDLPDVFLMLAHIGPDAMMRMILRKPPHERTSEDLEIIYEELLHIKALSHLSTMVKRELASVLLFESHAKSGTVLFNQGDEGKSWYIILKGSVNVVIYGKGVVCTLHEGDDFGKLALVNDAPRAATIVLRDDNCHFLRVDKEDFNRILRDVEANTVRLKEHGQDVLVLEKIPSNTQTADGSVQAHYKYSVMAGTPEKMLEHLLDSRLDNKNETEIDGFLEDFLLTHVIFMPCNHLCPVLLSHYHSSTADTTEQEGFEFMLNHKKCVLHFVQEWANIVGVAFKEDHTINAFLEELHSCVQDDLEDYPNLKDDLVTMETILNTHSGSPSSKTKKRMSGSFTFSRKHSKECYQDSPKRRKPMCPSEETIFKVYCADHTYSTLKLPMDTKVEQLLLSTKEKLGLGDDLILCEVKSTGERLIFKENDLCVTTGLSINGQLFVTPKEHLDALTPLPEQEGPSDGSFATIEMFSSREMAYHMTQYDWELFTCLQEYELIYQVFGRYKFGKITANLDLFLRRFNEIQFWIVTEMVLTNNLSKRVSLLRKFIKLAAHCKEFRNLNSFFAIVMGLSNIAVSRLSQTWEKLPSKFKKMFADFETLMDPSRNHRVYRLSVAKMQPPIIPFMPLLMKDMTFTHEGNKTYFDGLVNFEKMHMIAQTLKTVRFCRSARLDIEAPGTLKSSDTSEYIRSLKVIDNQRLLTQLSHKLEPRKT